MNSKLALLSIVLVAGLCATALAGDAAKSISLPAPDKTGGTPVQKALAERKSIRAYSDKPVDLQTLSSLLWATAGINREDGKRTAPSAHNSQAISLYVMLKSGIYFYNAKENRLDLTVAGDHTHLAGPQRFACSAPVNLLFVGDVEKLAGPKGWPGAVKMQYLFLGEDIGVMSENAYLYCASVGLGTVLRGVIQEADLGKVMNLPEGHVVLSAQTVGWPK